MTITLTPELERAVSQRAKRQGMTPERLAVEALNRLFLASETGQNQNDALHWKSLRHRYQTLVEKEFTLGLTAEEVKETERLGAEIDAAELANKKQPFAKLVATTQETVETRRGSMKERLLYMASDFDETPDDFKDPLK